MLKNIKEKRGKSSCVPKNIISCTAGACNEFSYNDDVDRIREGRI